MSTKKNKVSNKKIYDDVNLTKPRRESKYNVLVSYTRMRRKLKIEYLLPGGRVVQARCRILSSLTYTRDAPGFLKRQLFLKGQFVISFCYLYSECIISN